MRQEVGRAREQDGRDLARAAADRQDGPGEDAGARLRQHDVEDGLELVAPSASDASRSSRGTARSASSVATMTTGSVSTAMVSAAQISAGWPKTFSPWKNALSMPAPRNWTKKPRPNRPKTIDGTPARLATAIRIARVSGDTGEAYSCR